jgi:TetR/AcrR family transcriptional regulator, ethionamide resistance regulator
VDLEHSRRTQRRRAAGPSKGDRREAAILDAAEQLLGGTRHTMLTMDDIANATGMSRSSLYFYFASKEAVLAALHERTHAVMAAPIEVLQQGRAGPVESMRAAVALTLSIWREHAPALRAFHEIASVSEEFGVRWRANLDEHVESLAALIDAEREAGRAAPDPLSSREIASAWFWMLEHELYELFSRPHARSDEAQVADRLTRLWFRCIRSDEGP